MGGVWWILLLPRVAVKLRQFSKVGSYAVRQARTPTIRTYVFDSSGRAAKLDRDVHFTEAGATTSQPITQSDCFSRRLDSMAKEEGGKASTSGEETD